MTSNKILVIEDDKLAAQMVEETFRLEGFETIVAFDGQQGLDKIRRDKPDLVTLDIIMPNMDGWEVLRRVRAHPDTRHIPVIVVSAKIEDASKIFGLKQGADDYVTKPFNPLELTARAHAILQRVNRAKTEEASLADLGMIPVRRGDGFSLVDLSKIFYIDVKYGYACVHTYSDEVATCFTLTDIEKRLKKEQFFRAHRSQIVNLKQVKEVKPITRGSYLLILKDEKESQIAVSRRRVGALRERLGF